MPDTAYDPFPPSSDKNGMANTAAASEPVAYITAANNEVIYIALAATFGVLLFIVGFLLACLCVKNKRESTTEKEINNETVKMERQGTADLEAEEEPKGADKEIVQMGLPSFFMEEERDTLYYGVITNMIDSTAI